MLHGSISDRLGQLPEGWEAGAIDSGYTADGTNNWSVTTTRPKNGSYSLEYSAASGSGTFDQLAWTQDITTVSGTRYSCWVYIPSTASNDPSVTFMHDGAFGSEDYYRLYFDVSHGTALRIAESVNGSDSNIGVFTPGDLTGQWTRWEFDYNLTTAGEVSCEVFDSTGTSLGSGSSSGATAHADGGHGFAKFSGTDAFHWDDYREV